MKLCVFPFASNSSSFRIACSRRPCSPSPKVPAASVGGPFRCAVVVIVAREVVVVVVVMFAFR